ncbi:hypothetical protein MSG28_005918 [Choristoneura fumiferana]|uniref:Uncharacterized protein n=1 Tax=Choristoneura fumiferana TaxID=7141 RepID=A0ACC0L0V8_CHOFU|nr:hypothetical protein MSG28_005918 [Choristoneura fumiferana]
MASNKGKKPMGKDGSAVTIPECPVCLEPMRSPIFLCMSGHSLCSSCTKVLNPANCPLCRQPMTQMRNRTLEDLTEKAKVQCPNHAAGCVYQLSNAAVAEHVKECIFRLMECPFGAVFGRCSWSGHLHQIMEHFKQKHPEACDCGPQADADVELENMSLRQCDRRLLLAAQNKYLFIITVKVDTIQRMAYWTVQHIGPKKQAHQYLYEIHLNSKREPQRKIVFTEHCFSDTVKVEEIIRQNNCAVLPLGTLGQFIMNDKLNFRYLIRRVNEKPKPDENAAPNSENAHSRSASRTRGNGPKPKGPWPKGPGPKGPGPKGPGPRINANKS